MLGCTSRERHGTIHYPGKHLEGSQAAGGFCRLNQPCFAPLLVPAVHTFRNPVSEQHHHIFRRECETTLLIRAIPQETDHWSAILQASCLNSIRRSPQYGRRIMPSIDIRKSARGRIVLPEEEGCVAVRAGSFAE